MADPARARKLADRIREIIAIRLERGMRDPRFGFVTITDVRVTGDLQHASVFYTVYGTDQERSDTAIAFQAATGMLRSEVGKNITARLTPTLEFIADAIPENASHVEDLLRAARDRDAEVAGLASVATYAGEEDPYVKPRDERGDERGDEPGDDLGEEDPYATPRDGPRDERGDEPGDDLGEEDPYATPRGGARDERGDKRGDDLGEGSDLSDDADAGGPS